jgi:hypothetical protein
MNVPLPELAPGNVVRLKSSGDYGLIVGHLPPDMSGFIGVTLYLWNAVGFLAMEGHLPVLIESRADDLIIVTISGLDTPYPEGLDLHPWCPYCGGYGYVEPVTVCRQCGGWGKSKIPRRIHPELLPSCR